MSSWVALNMPRLYILPLEILFLFCIELFSKVLQRKFDLITFQAAEFSHSVEYPPVLHSVLTQIPIMISLQVLKHQDWSSHLWSNQSFHLLGLPVFAQICSIEIQKSTHAWVSFFFPPSNRSLGSCWSIHSSDGLHSCPPLASSGHTGLFLLLKGAKLIPISGALPQILLSPETSTHWHLKSWVLAIHLKCYFLVEVSSGYPTWISIPLSCTLSDLSLVFSL